MWFVYDKIASPISLDNLHVISKFYKQINSHAMSCSMQLGEFDSKETGRGHLGSKKLQYADGGCLKQVRQRKLENCTDNMGDISTFIGLLL